jgi:hypothetical protein
MAVSSEGTAVAFVAPDKSASVTQDKGGDFSGRIEGVAAAKEGEQERPLAIIEAKAYWVSSGGGERDVKFDIHTSSVEKATGFEFQKDKVYEIHWSVNGKGDFTKEYRGNSDHFVLFVPREHRDEVDTSKRSRVEIQSIRERHEVPVIDEGGRAKIVIAKSIIHSAGLREFSDGDTLSMHLRDKSTNRDSPEVFVTMRGDHARVSASGLGFSAGDKLELATAEMCRLADFASRFNTHLSREMQNVRLDLKPNPSLEVDGSNLRLEGPKLQTYDSQIVLRSRLESFQDGRVVYADGRTIPPSGSKVYLWYSGLERQSWITYTSGRHQHTPNRLTVQKELGEVPPAIDGKLMQESMRLYSTEGVEGRLKFRVTQDLVDRINNRLVWAAQTDRFTHERGSIAEELSVCVLEAGGWKELKRHPLADRPSSHSANEHGPDSLMEWKPTSTDSFHEIKWWDDPGAARSYARTQVFESRETWISRGGRRVGGAFIDILDMKRMSREGELHVERVW